MTFPPIPTLQSQVMLKNHTSFKVGGPARWYASPAHEQEIEELLKWAQGEKLPVFILGRGTNLVVSDGGFPGLVLHLGPSFAKVEVSGESLMAQSGALLSTVVNRAIRAGLGGMECLAGIPGTVGGAIKMNAGAYGQEICQVVHKVRSMQITPPYLRHLRTTEQCEFSYRHSLFQNIDELVLEVEIHLVPGNGQILQGIMQEKLRKRKEQQPVELPNAGSMFKRPQGSFAGMLIEKSGLKGMRIGGAAVSEKHAGFVVNLGGASAGDIWRLSQHIIAKVQQDHGIILEREVVFLGDF